MRRVFQLCLLALVSLATAEQGNYDDGAQQDDGVGNDDGAQNYYYNNVQQSNGFFSAGNDYIKYWTDYAILPMRCIV